MFFSASSRARESNRNPGERGGAVVRSTPFLMTVIGALGRQYLCMSRFVDSLTAMSRATRRVRAWCADYRDHAFALLEWKTLGSSGM